MHIIIGLITAVAGLLWALNSLQRGGLDIGWLNPFAWNHRRKWRQKYEKVPLYNLQNTMEVAAVLIVGTLKQKGELTREQKQFAISTFKKTFNLTDDEAAELFGSSSFLLRNINMEIDEHIDNILEKLKDDFSDGQVSSLIELIQAASEQEGSATNAQKRTLNNVCRVFERKLSGNHW